MRGGREWRPHADTSIFAEGKAVRRAESYRPARVAEERFPPVATPSQHEAGGSALAPFTDGDAGARPFHARPVVLGVGCAQETDVIPVELVPFRLGLRDREWPEAYFHRSLAY